MNHVKFNCGMLGRNFTVVFGRLGIVGMGVKDRYSIGRQGNVRLSTFIGLLENANDN